MPETGLTTIINGNVPALNSALDGLWASLERTAAQNIANAAGADIDHYTQIEQRAMLRAEMLNQAKGLDLASVLIKGRIVDEIEREGLFTVHPAGYHTLEQLATDQGISISELSQIKDLTRVVFPWVVENLGITIYDLWESVGKSNMRELVPVLKRVITGEEARGSVEGSYQRLLGETQAGAEITGQELGADETRRLMVETLLSDAGSLTNANLRQRLRPDPMDSIECHVLHLDGKAYIIAALDDRQETFVNRRLHGYWDPIRIDAADLTREELRSVLRNYDALDLAL